MGVEIDVETGQQRWASQLTEPDCLGDQIEYSDSAACYSPGWGLLAIARRRTVGFGTRAARRPPGRVRKGERPKDHHPVLNYSCVHLDAGVDGNWSGHLLHLPPGTNDRIHVYDIAGWAAARRRPRSTRWRMTNCRWWRDPHRAPWRAGPPHRRLLRRGRRRPRRELFPAPEGGREPAVGDGAAARPPRGDDGGGGDEEAAEEAAAKAAKAKARRRRRRRRRSGSSRRAAG